MAGQPTGTRRCRTCEETRDVGDFYESATECAGCKKDRSRQGRQIAAQKIALAERVIDLFVDLMNQGWRPDLCHHANAKQPPASVVTAQPEA